jgi:hypothetical protein
MPLQVLLHFFSHCLTLCQKAMGNDAAQTHFGFMIAHILGVFVKHERV